MRYLGAGVGAFLLFAAGIPLLAATLVPLDMADTSVVQQSSAEATAEREDRWLDRWLIDSFPASDPLPGPSAIGGPAYSNDYPEPTDATKQGGPQWSI
jgi:hypothetical protein